MFSDQARYDQLTEGIINCGIAVHTATGAGLLESIYTSCLVLELRAQGFRVQTERTIPVVYRGVRIAHFRLDLVVEDLVIIEVKSVMALEPVHQAQIITYSPLLSFSCYPTLPFSPSPVITSGRFLRRP